MSLRGNIVIRHLILAAAAVGAMMPSVVDAVEPANCTGIISFASDAEKNWVEAVYDHTDMTCLQTRWVYRNRPGLRDEFPGNHIWTSWATPVPSPAFSTAGTKWCRVTTVEKYRAPIIPFGDHVLFSFRMDQTFAYNGSTVSTGLATINPDTTANGWRWHFDGIVASQEGYLDGLHTQHQTDKWAGFSTDSVAELTSVHSTLHDKIWVQNNGDWATMNTNGLSDCRNP